MANKSLWKDRYLFDIYAMAKDGERESVMAKILGVSLPTFRKWEEKRPLVRLALEVAREEYKRKKRRRKNETSDIANYIFDRLSPEMRKVWRRLSKIEEAKGSQKMIDAVFEGRGKKFRQHLFLYAWINNRYLLTDACRAVGIPIRTFNLWREDPEFWELFQEIQHYKKDYIESHLFKLIGKGSEAATIFAAKTQIKDDWKNYDEKGQQIDVNINANVNSNMLPFEEIRPLLSTECQMEILEAMRKRKQIQSEVIEQQRNMLPSTVIDTKFEDRRVNDE